MLRAGSLATCLFVLVGCEEEVEVKELPPRSVKTIIIEDFVGEQSRRLAGKIRAQTESDIAFEVSGRVKVLSREIGEAVTAGEIIASLDKEAYQLRVNAAEAGLSEAQANRKNAKAKFDQQHTLYGKGFATKTDYDTAKANLSTTTSSVKAAQAELDITKRDLALTELRAPFAGTVGARYVDPFSEISSGQKIYQIVSESQNEVLVSLPENLLQNIALGTKAKVEILAQDISIDGQVTEIGSQPNAASAYEMTVALNSQPKELRAGMTAQVTFSFSSGSKDQGSFILPVTAVQPLPEADTGRVFVVDTEKGVVNARTVTVINIVGNQIEVIGDLKPGDALVSAGTSFVTDGMKVRLMAGKVR